MLTRIQKCLLFSMAFSVVLLFDLSYSQKAIIVDNIQVKSVVDGETLRISTGAKVRYIGVNVPAGMYFQAMEANRQLVAGKKIKLEFDVEKQDGYGRIMAYVFVDSILVNARLISEGYAKFAPHPKNARYQHIFLDLESKAKESKAGLWAPESRSNVKNHLKGKLEFDIGNTFVYVASEDKRYHRVNCSEMKSHRIPMVLKDAKLTYSACKICNPLKDAGPKTRSN